MKKWEVYDSKTVVKNQWITVKCDRCITEDGVEIPDYYWIDAYDFAIIFGTTPEGKVVMVEQYRHGVKDTFIEFPGGIIDDDEDPAEAARRELLEETGYSSDEFMFKKVLYQAPASVDAKGYLFFARNLKQIGNQDLDSTENINIKLFEFDKLQDMIDSNLFGGTFTLASILLALQNREWFFGK